MSGRYDVLVFDWDGTLIDSAAHIAASLQAAFRDLGLKVPSDEAARYVIGLGLEDTLQYLDPALDKGRYQELVERYRVHFLAGDGVVELFPEVASGIPILQQAGYLMAVATGKSRRGLDRSLLATGLHSYFHASRCADEGFPKPHPDMLHEIMRALGAAPERTLMIGDTTHDLQMAQNAGVPAVAVAYGAHVPAKLKSMNPLACVESFGQLMQWLQQNG